MRIGTKERPRLDSCFQLVNCRAKKSKTERGLEEEGVDLGLVRKAS